MITANPPEHGRLRGLVASAFTPSRIDGLRSTITSRAQDCTRDLDGESDVMTQLAQVFPMTIIGEMLGVPASLRDELAPYLPRAVAPLEYSVTWDVLVDAEEAIADVTALLVELIDQRRREPTDDLLSALVHAEQDGDQLSFEELVSTVLLLYGAGAETTTNLIGNGLFALLESPDQLERLRADRTLVKTAVEELLRWDTPVPIDGRAALDEVDLLGTRLERGAQLVVLLGAANRDPRKWDAPLVLDVARRGPAPLSFGAGIHFCLGATLARTQAAIVFETLLATFRKIEPAWVDRPRYRPSIMMRGLESLTVRFER
jgi:cytochrome P450